MAWLGSPCGSGRSLSTSPSGLMRSFSGSRTPHPLAAPESSPASLARGPSGPGAELCGSAGLRPLLFRNSRTRSCRPVHVEMINLFRKGAFRAAAVPSSGRNRSSLKAAPSKAQPRAQQGPPGRRAVALVWLWFCFGAGAGSAPNAGFADRPAGQPAHPVAAQVQPPA